MGSRMSRVLRTRMAWTAFVAAGLTLAVGASSWGAPARTAAGKTAADVKRALKLGKAADRKATKALRTAREAAAAAKPGPAGPVGAAGATGSAGAEGPRGLQGVPGSGVGYA